MRSTSSSRILWDICHRTISRRSLTTMTHNCMQKRWSLIQQTSTSPRAPPPSGILSSSVYSRFNLLLPHPQGKGTVTNCHHAEKTPTSSFFFYSLPGQLSSHFGSIFIKSTALQSRNYTILWLRQKLSPHRGNGYNIHKSWTETCCWCPWKAARKLPHRT